MEVAWLCSLPLWTPGTLAGYQPPAGCLSQAAAPTLSNPLWLQWEGRGVGGGALAGRSRCPDNTVTVPDLHCPQRLNFLNVFICEVWSMRSEGHRDD